jgi:hypothetical protein
MYSSTSYLNGLTDYRNDFPSFKNIPMATGTAPLVLALPAIEIAPAAK